MCEATHPLFCPSEGDGAGRGRALMLVASQPPGDTVINVIPGVLCRDPWFPAMCTCTPLAMPFQKEKKVCFLGNP